MVRRTWLRIVMSVTGLAFLAGDWAAGLAGAQDTRKTGVPGHLIPTSPGAAIASNNADRVCAFILTYPAAAAGASLNDKSRMLSLMRGSVRGGNWADVSVQYDQPAYERAMVTVLRGHQARPGELQQLVGALGGKNSVAAVMPVIQNAELRSLASQGAR